MTATILDEYIRPILLRYIDTYHWSFNTSARLINRYFGTGYTTQEIKEIYCTSTKAP